MYQDITIEQLLVDQENLEMTLIDVRSPQEFAEATIPDSINIPFFNDEERKEIGILYKQVSIAAAKTRGLEIISQKLPSFVAQFQQISGRKVVFCWRGGMRSKTTSTVLDLMGVHVSRLDGGFRSYRRWVTHTLEGFQLNSSCIVLNGNTGTAKTLILKRLAVEGYPVVDLETMAQHRGSIFGHIGLTPNNQKSFESLLVQSLLRFNEGPYIIIEAESKRVGRVVLPEFLVQAKERGTHIFVDMPIPARVENILQDYHPEQHKEAAISSFQRIKKRMHTPIAAEIDTLLVEEKYPEAIALLLEHYYDEKYEHTAQQYYDEAIIVKSSNMEDAYSQVKLHIDLLLAKANLSLQANH